MRLLIVFALASSWLCAQTCAPNRVQPSGSFAGTLDAGSCVLSDSTAYTAYSFNLPVRGQMQIDLDSGGAALFLILRNSSGAAVATGVTIRTPLEEGDYSLLVNTRSPGVAGGYNVKMAFTAEPGMLCTSFPNLGLHQTVSGALGASGCTAPDGTAYEGYTVTTMGAGTLTISAGSSEFSTSLLFRDSDGRLIGSDIHTVSVPVYPDTQYQVVVTTADLKGAYLLTTSFQPSPAATCQSLRTLNDTVTDNGNVGATSCTVTYEGSGDLAYYNYYNLVITNSGLADIRVDSREFTPTLILLDGAGNSLATDSDGPYSSSLLLRSELRLQLNPGSYTLQVFSNVNSGGDYSLAYQFTPGLPQPCAPAVAVKPAVTGTLSVASCRTSLGLSDAYTLTLPTPGTVDLTLTSDDFVPQIAIRDAKDNTLVRNHDQLGLGVAHIAADLPAGTYNIVAAATSGSGAYQITTVVTAHEVPACNGAYPLALNGTYYQYLGQSQCHGANGQPVDLYEFTLPTDGVIASVVASSDIDGYLTLLDTSGNVLRSDDNTYGTGDPLIVQFLPAGTYRLAARAAEATPGGPYALALYAALEPRPPFCSSRGVLAIGASIKGNINSAGCQYPDNTLADLYRIDLAADATIDLRLNSGDFDAYLVLLDGKGNLVAADDDHGGGTNARITRATKAGTYFVVAKPLSDYFSQGDYTLSLVVQ